MPIGKKETTRSRGNQVKLRCFCEKNCETANELEKQYTKYQKTAYPLVIGQCLPALRAQLKGTKNMIWSQVNKMTWRCSRC